MNNSHKSPIYQSLLPLASSPLTEENIEQIIRPLFSRTLQQSTQQIYLANHSLGRILDQTEKDILQGLELWIQNDANIWDHWQQEVTEFRQQVAMLLRAPDYSCIIPKTSAGQGLRTILNCYDPPLKILSSADEFNSIDHILKTYQQRNRIQLMRINPNANYTYQIQDFIAALTEDTDLIVISMVMFTTGQLLANLSALVKAAHDQGTKVLIDVYHAVGVVPVNVLELDVDFAIGGSYKYLHGGPGACWLFIHPRHLDGSLKTLDTGWFAQPKALSFYRDEQPELAPGGDSFLESTPAILPYYQARAGLTFIRTVGVERLREYNLKQQTLMENLLQQHAIPCLGEKSNRGAFIAISHPHADRIATQLKQCGIISDAREGLLRLCPGLLNTRAEITTAIGELAKIWKTQ